MSLPEVHLIGGTGTEAGALAPVATALRSAGLLAPVLVAAGPDAAMGRTLAAAGLRADVTLHTDPEPGPLGETIRRLGALWSSRPPAAVLVAGDGATGLAAALAAAWRRIPVVHLTTGGRLDEFGAPAGGDPGARLDEFGAPAGGDPGARLITQVAALHLVPVPIVAMNLLDEGIAAGAILITGDTARDASPAAGGRRVPPPRVPAPNPYGDGCAAQRAAQATAALLGLADRPAPMPIPSFPAPAAGARFGA